MQLSLWYPARPPAGAPRMSAGEFRLLSGTEVDFDRTPDEPARERLRAEFIDAAAGFGQDPAVAARTWDEPTPAVRDAPPLPGPERAATFASSEAARATIMGIAFDAYPRSIPARFAYEQALADSGRTAEAGAALEAALPLVEGDDSLDDASRAQWRDRIASVLDAIR